MQKNFQRRSSYIFSTSRSWVKGLKARNVLLKQDLEITISLPKLYNGNPLINIMITKLF